MNSMSMFFGTFKQNLISFYQTVQWSVELKSDLKNKLHDIICMSRHSGEINLCKAERILLLQTV